MDLAISLASRLPLLDRSGMPDYDQSTMPGQSSTFDLRYSIPLDCPKRCSSSPPSPRVTRIRLIAINIEIAIGYRCFSPHFGDERGAVRREVNEASVTAMDLAAQSTKGSLPVEEDRRSGL